MVDDTTVVGDALCLSRVARLQSDARLIQESLLKRVYRKDQVGLDKAERTPEGWLRCDAFLTRVGVFLYPQVDGSTRRELRLPEEVFDVGALKSFASVPVTKEHPHALLDDHSARSYALGANGENVERDGDWVHSRLLVYDHALVEALEGGKRQVSCGYSCDLDEQHGWHPQYGEYDAIQRNIRGNHVAIVDHARAGEGAHVRVDHDAVKGVTRMESQLAKEQPPTNAGNKGNDNGSMMVPVEHVQVPKSEYDNMMAEHAAMKDELAKLKGEGTGNSEPSADDDDEPDMDDDEGEWDDEENAEIHGGEPMAADPKAGEPGRKDSTRRAKLVKRRDARKRMDRRVLRLVEAQRRRDGVRTHAAHLGVRFDEARSTDANRRVLIHKISPELRLDNRTRAWCEAALDLEMARILGGRARQDAQYQAIGAGIGQHAHAPSGPPSAYRSDGHKRLDDSRQRMIAELHEQGVRPLGKGR